MAFVCCPGIEQIHGFRVQGLVSGCRVIYCIDPFNSKRRPNSKARLFNTFWTGLCQKYWRTSLIRVTGYQILRGS